MEENTKKIISNYKVFAYMKNSERPKVLFANSKEKVLLQLREWNKTRTAGFTYDTCNIGEYNLSTKQFENFKKIDVNSGKNIANIYLRIPKHLSGEKFQEILQYFKENGAQFNPIKKEWYIREELKDKFIEYLSDEQQNLEANKSSEKQFPEEELERKYSAIQFISNINNKYVIDLKNGETIRISESELLKRSGETKIKDLTARKIVEVVEQKVEEHIHLLQQEEYSISVSNQKFDNRCTVYMKNGDSVDLFGDQFGVYFPAMKDEEVKNIVKDYMKTEMTKQLQIEIQKGEKVTLYTPLYQEELNGIKEICGIKQISGEVQKATPEIYVLKTPEGKVEEVKRSEIYNERQREIMKRAMSAELLPEQMDLVGQTKLSAAQMEQILNGLKDGLSSIQVAMYANPSLQVWKMDIYRYAMGNGIPFDSIKDIVEKNNMKPTQWEDSRNMVDNLIKAQRNLIVTDLKDNHIKPEKHLVRKIEKLNGLTGKIHTVKEIMFFLKKNESNPDFMRSDSGNLMKEIGKEVTHQQRQRAKALVPTAKMPCR